MAFALFLAIAVVLFLFFNMEHDDINNGGMGNRGY